MSRLPLVAALSALAASFVGCAANRPSVYGSGTIKTEDRAVAGFHAVTLAGTGDLIITQGSSEGLEVEADDNLLPFIKTTQDGGDLIIHWDETIHPRPSKAVRYRLTVRALDSVSLSGSGTVSADEFTGDSLKVSISGSADVTFPQLRTKDFILSISGSGTLKAGGTTDSFQVKVSGSGDVKAKELKANRVSVSVAGSGDAEVWAEESLSVNVAGSGDVRYKGEPQNLEQSVAGSGSVKRVK
jgi:hypothetical protein